MLQCVVGIQYNYGVENANASQTDSDSAMSVCDVDSKSEEEYVIRIVNPSGEIYQIYL
jgi:hypothetical protein